MGLVGGRVKEALRIARQMTTGRKKVLPYYWYKYQDRRDTDLTRVSKNRCFRKTNKRISKEFASMDNTNRRRAINDSGK